MLLGLEAAGGRDPVIPPVSHLALSLSLGLKRSQGYSVEIRTELSQQVELKTSGAPAPLGLRC